MTKYLYLLLLQARERYKIGGGDNCPLCSHSMAEFRFMQRLDMAKTSNRINGMQHIPGCMGCPLFTVATPESLENNCIAIGRAFLKKYEQFFDKE